MRISDWSSDVCSSDLTGMVTDVTGAGGTAQGGTIDLLASNGGLIHATSTTASSSFSTDAQSGSRAGRAAATAGPIQLIAAAVPINFAALAHLSAAGTTRCSAVFLGFTLPHHMTVVLG